MCALSQNPTKLPAFPVRGQRLSENPVDVAFITIIYGLDIVATGLQAAMAAEKKYRKEKEIVAEYDCHTKGKILIQF